MAQRLVRKVCPHCAVDDILTDEQVHLLKLCSTRGKRLKVKRGKGCIECRYTGYLGRTGLFEVLQVTPRIRTDQRACFNSGDQARALNDGMLTLWEYGIKKSHKG